jgi:hypothetical protein
MNFPKFLVVFLSKTKQENEFGYCETLFAYPENFERVRCVVKEV